MRNKIVWQKAFGLTRTVVEDVEFDDLAEVVRENASRRADDIRRAEEMAASATREFVAWAGRLKLGPTVSALREKVEAIRKSRIAEVSGKLSGLREGEKKAVERLTEDIVAAILHEPLHSLKQMHNKDELIESVSVLRKLFSIDTTDDKLNTKS